MVIRNDDKKSNNFVEGINIYSQLFYILNIPNRLAR